MSSDASSDTEGSPVIDSESDPESWNCDEEQPLVNYTAEVEHIIQSNVHVTTANAIRLNQEYQLKLKLMRSKLAGMLGHCREQLRHIDEKIEDCQSRAEPPRSAGKPRICGYICGQPFFKDHALYPGPHNEDYLRRKNVMKEFFPLDLYEASDALWTVKDKLNVKKAVAAQMREFLQRENALQAKRCNNSTTAQRFQRELDGLGSLTAEQLWPRVIAYDGSYGGQRFVVDWLKISYIRVSQRHTPEACEGIWNNYLRPGLRRSAWKPDEESRLIEAATRYRCQEWAKIAEYVQDRSEYQCFVHYQAHFSPMAQNKKMPWSEEEDRRLVETVERHRIGNNIIWNKVVESMPFRNKIQVYNRYKFTLTRPIKHSKFSAEEDCLILAYVEQYGTDFKSFPEVALLPGRTVRQVYARYKNTLSYVNKRASWSLAEDERLMRYVEPFLADGGAHKISWSDCATALGNHSRLSCRTRYYTIERFLTKHPNAKLEDVPRRDTKKLSSAVTDKNWRQTIYDIRSSNPAAGARQFCDTLANISERKLYEQMMFSFRYKFGYRLDVSSRRKHVYAGTKMLLHLLEGFYRQVECSKVEACNVPLNKTEVSTLFTVIQSPLDWPRLVATLRSNLALRTTDPFVCRFPPSYNTVVGLRGVCLNASYEQNEGRTETRNQELKRMRAPDKQLFDESIARFEERFRMIFHWTILLTMLNIDDVVLQQPAEPREATGDPAAADSDTDWDLDDELLNQQGLVAVVFGDGEASLLGANREQHAFGHEPTLSAHHLQPLTLERYMRAPEATAVVPVNESGNPGSLGNAMQNITIIDPKDMPAAVVENTAPSVTKANKRPGRPKKSSESSKKVNNRNVAKQTASMLTAAPEIKGSTKEKCIASKRPEAAEVIELPSPAVTLATTQKKARKPRQSKPPRHQEQEQSLSLDQPLTASITPCAPPTVVGSVVDSEWVPANVCQNGANGLSVGLCRTVETVDALPALQDRRVDRQEVQRLQTDHDEQIVSVQQDEEPPQGTEQNVQQNVDSDEGSTSPDSDYDDLMTQVDESFTAVDIIRLLSARQQAKETDSETDEADETRQ
ncbi:uncharacterized protein LOC131211682 [Anopheles bellator]|uniref:uncharacterized protein LOC131211682 n=1 Tax=Anopheles bellator TaxID=139047 RepID=UPI00264A175D|nr:uncharacterized protein LOC131211682 [Anopheles bellator]